MAAAVAPSMSSSAIVSSVGPFYIGVLGNVAIGGVNWAQLLEYYRRSPQDRPLVRFAVLAVLLLAAIHTVFSCHIIWFYLIQNYGDAGKLADCVWSFGVDPLLTALIAAFVQAHYAYRLYLVGKRSMWVPAVVGLLTSFQLGAGAYCTVIAVLDPSWVNIHRRLDGWVAAWLFSMAAADLVITGALTYHLARVKSDFDSTNTLINRIVRNIVANNALTAVTAIASGILFVASRSTGWHIIFGITLARFYTMSFLSSLNARHSIRTDLSRRPSPPPPTPKPFILTAREPDSPDLAPLPTETTSNATHLFVRPALARTNSAQSGTSTVSWMEKRRPQSQWRSSERGLGMDTLPISIQIESQLTDEPSTAGLWDPSLSFAVPSPPLSTYTAAGRGDVLLDMPFSHAIEVTLEGKPSS
ncbi:hypothetical protein JCM8208_006572 [Rhodotorula glutinis]